MTWDVAQMELAGLHQLQMHSRRDLAEGVSVPMVFMLRHKAADSRNAAMAQLITRQPVVWLSNRAPLEIVAHSSFTAAGGQPVHVYHSEPLPELRH